MNGYRARRIVDVFESKDRLSAEDHARLHLDWTSISGQEFVARLEGLPNDDPDVRLALDLLRGWDCLLTPESAAGSVFEVSLYHLTRHILEPVLGEALALDVMSRGPHPLLLPATEFNGHAVVTILRLLDDPDSWWLAQAGGREAALSGALKQAVHWLRAELGPAPDGWAWGRLHKILFAHALSTQAPLDRVFNIGPFPIGGDGDTVPQTAYLPQAPYTNTSWAPSFRQIVDMGDLAHARVSYPPGQSGQVGSPHYDDLARPWLEGEYFTVLWTREAVEEACGERLVLGRE
jgi:penicillin amidase